VKVSNLKIGARLASGFAIVLALMLILTGIGISNMSKIEDNLNNVVHHTLRKMELLQEMSDSVHIVSSMMRTAVILNDVAEINVEYKKIEEARARYDTAFAALEKMPASEAGKALRNKIREQGDLARPLNNKVIELAKENHDAEATALLMKSAGPATEKWQGALHEDIALLKETNEKETVVAHQAYTTARLLMFIFTGIALVLGALLAWLVTRSITRPIQDAVKVAKTVAAGDLSSRIEVTSKDETSELLQSLSEMNDSLVRIVGEVRMGTDTIASVSTQIANGNLDLSSRTEQQAGSLEETASSMEELTSTVKQNGDNARQANQLALSASEVAVKGGVVVSEVVQTMSSINESARKIADIIGVIDGIAFQTNILALNAAVEAARAGEQGRGFAVVASEVRSLAQRSASAAKEIKSLIDDSVGKVDAGSRLVDQAGATMDEIVASVKRVTDIIGEITSASHEQEAGIEQINQAITEMDNVTQQNASLVEEASAAASSLRDQAANLAQVVSVFKLGAASAPASRLQSATPARSDINPSDKKPGQALIAASNSPHIRKTPSAPAVTNDEWEQF